jgi:uncharacterized membrane protein YdjX (TVP38/TMEM64 family)
VHRGPPGGGTWTGVAVTIAGVLVGIGVAMAVPTLRDAVFDAIHGNTAQLRHDLHEDALGPLLVVWLALVHVVVWYPAEILDAAAGYVFGFGAGFPLVMGSWVLSAIASYEVGRHFARPLLYRVAGERRFQRLERLIHRGGITVLLAVRLIPIMPFSLMGYVCGATKVPRVRFIWTTAVGYAPLTAYFTYLGSQLEGFSAEDPILWIGGAAILGGLLCVRFLVPGAVHDDSQAREPKPEPTRD